MDIYFYYKNPDTHWNNYPAITDHYGDVLLNSAAVLNGRCFFIGLFLAVVFVKACNYW